MKPHGDINAYDVEFPLISELRMQKYERLNQKSEKSPPNRLKPEIVMVVHGGFLDPEVYTKGRKMTVAGNVLGTLVEEIDESSLQYLKIQSREIYLWSEKKYYYPVSFWDRWYWGPWYDPYFYGWD